jgi:hypothetical protein
MGPIPKSEARIPEDRRKAEIRNPKNRLTRIDADFGLRPSFGFRYSDFGLGRPSNNVWLAGQTDLAARNSQLIE